MLIIGYGLIKHRESCNSKFHSGEYLKIAAITILYPPPLQTRNAKSLR